MRNTEKKRNQLVSVHGGHSGQFCLHAKDSLEEIVRAYLTKGFAWVGLTEHVPPASDAWRYLDEIEAGLSAADLHNRFKKYIQEARRLQELFQDQLPILVGMEIETCRGCLEFAEGLRQEFQPDYIVGSVHFVEDICFDYSREEYLRAAKQVGGIEELYCHYFDLQYEMLQQLKPEVVGHFDLIRLFDDRYHERLALPRIWRKVVRNLELIKQHNFILDLNLRPLLKGGSEPYNSRPILELARDMHILVVPGDDSHSVSTVGCHMTAGIALLTRLGFNTDWPRPDQLSST